MKTNAQRIPAIDAGAEIDAHDVQKLYRLAIKLQLQVETLSTEVIRLTSKVSYLEGALQP